MLYVDRNSIQVPPHLDKKLREETEKLISFNKQLASAQLRPQFNEKILRQVKSILKELFKNKCAYCESPVEAVSHGYIEHFRPKSVYWWLAYEWSNFYFACQVCNFNKRDSFPIVNTQERASNYHSDLRKEKALLLDPCVDNPAQHFRYEIDETLKQVSMKSCSLLSEYGRTNSEVYDQGQVTIDTLGLNRQSLMHQRYITASTFNLFTKTIESVSEIDNSRDYLQQLINMMNVDASFAGMSRQLLANKLVRKPNLRLSQLIREPRFLSEKIRQLLEEIKPHLDTEEYFLNLSQTKTESIPKKTTHKIIVPRTSDATYIERIEISNFKAIRDFDITINNSEFISHSQETNQKLLTTNEGELKASWKMLLGENGAGKSSVLKAISLALIGSKEYRAKSKRYRLTPEQIFNNKTRSKDGYIKLVLSKGDPIEVQFTKQNLKFTSRKDGAAQVFVRGYGAARFFSRNNVSQKRERKNLIHDLSNLFHPEQILTAPDMWLLGLDHDDFNKTALTFRDLLNINENIEPVLRIKPKRKGRVYLNSGDGEYLLADQSDGYNSILAMMTDIMAGVPQKDKSRATGIVLLDEIDSHLHPQWKMRIVDSLRRCFPFMQFISTTHEPLCLRGLGDNEIVIMKKDRQKQGVSIQDGISSPVGLRVDQLLTSELFGLETTADPDTESKFKKYYEFIARDSLTDEETIEAERLKKELAQYNRIGATRRDQLVYEYIDKYLAIKDSLSKSDQQSWKDNTKKRVFEIWNRIQHKNEIR